MPLNKFAQFVLNGLSLAFVLLSLYLAFLWTFFIEFFLEHGYIVLGAIAWILGIWMISIMFCYICKVVKFIFYIPVH